MAVKTCLFSPADEDGAESHEDSSENDACGNFFFEDDGCENDRDHETKLIDGSDLGCFAQLQRPEIKQPG